LFVEEEGEDDVLEVDTSTENNVLSTLLTQTTMMNINESNAMSIEENGAWASFDSKVHALVTHYGHCYNKGELHWVRKSNEGVRGFYPVGNRKVGSNRVMDRVLQTKMDEINAASDNDNKLVYLGYSKYKSAVSGKGIGVGLFTKVAIAGNTTICEYIGEVMTKSEYEKEAKKGRSHFCVLVSQSQYLNCYKNALTGKCMASFANSPVQLVGNPKQNARIVGKKIVSISSIAANEEILVSYGLGYRFPSDTDRTVLRI